MKTLAGNGKRWLLGLLAVLACVSVSRRCQPVLGQAADNLTIHGQVLDSTRSPIPGATIRLERVSDGWKMETRSGAKGEFSFADLVTGDYSMVAELAGRRSSIIEAVAPQEAPLVIVLG